MIRKFNEFIVNEENSVEDLRKIKKICNEYGYKLLKGYIKENNIELRFEYDPEKPVIIYSSRDNRFEISVNPVNYLPIKEYKVFCDKCNNALELVKKLEKLDLMKLLPKFIE